MAVAVAALVPFAAHAQSGADPGGVLAVAVPEILVFLRVFALGRMRINGGDGGVFRRQDPLRRYSRFRRGRFGRSGCPSIKR